MKIMNKTKKREIVDWLTEEFKNSTIIVLGNFSGLTVSEMQNLRQSVKERYGNLKVIKNSLIERAFNNLSQDECINYLEGPIFVIWTREGDEVEIIKDIYSFQKKTGKIKIKGGIVNNKTVDANFLEKLSKLPSIKEIQIKIIYNIKFPVIRVINSIRGPVVKIINIVNQIKEKKEREK